MFLLDVDRNVEVLKTFTRKMFFHLWNVSFFTLEFFVVDHNVDDILLCEGLAYLDTFFYEHLQFTIDKFINMTLMRKKLRSKKL